MYKTLSFNIKIANTQVYVFLFNSWIQKLFLEIYETFMFFMQFLFFYGIMWQFSLGNLQTESYSSKDDIFIDFAQCRNIFFSFHLFFPRLQKIFLLHQIVQNKRSVY